MLLFIKNVLSSIFNEISVKTPWYFLRKMQYFEKNSYQNTKYELKCYETHVTWYDTLF